MVELSLGPESISPGFGLLPRPWLSPYAPFLLAGVVMVLLVVVGVVVSLESRRPDTVPSEPWPASVVAVQSFTATKAKL
jgi:hypothetical protein